MIVESLRASAAYLGVLTPEQVLVVLIHVAVWVRYLPWACTGLSGLSPDQEIRRLRQSRRYGDGIKPGYLAAGMSISWALARGIVWTAVLAVLAKNYLVSHHDWSVAVFFFLTPVVLGLEGYLRWSSPKYKMGRKRKSVERVGV